MVEITRKLYDQVDDAKFKFKVPNGISEEVVRQISEYKEEPEWMLQKRLDALKIFNELEMPNWGPDLSKLDLQNICYFAVPDANHNSQSWDDVPEDIKKTFDRLGIPEAEKKALAGAGAQYESQVVYHNLREDLKEQGVIFEDMDIAVKEYPELVKKYYMKKCISPRLHKFSALHGAVWSGGTFIYVPPGVKVDQPLQAYFRMNSISMGQFEHTLIIVDEGAEVHYIEGCSAPKYNAASLHAGAVEVFVHKNARMRYSSVENWSESTYNLNTKRANVEENGVMEWVSGNLGCLTADTKVSTNPKGPTNIAELKPGDKVFAWNQKTNKLERSKVKGMIHSGYKQVYKLNVAGRELEATDNHPFLKLERIKNKESHKKAFFKEKWVELKDLKEGDLIAITKSLPEHGAPYKLPKFNYDKKVKSKNQYSYFEMSLNNHYNKIKFPEETNEDLMWFLGLLLGDGHIWKDKSGGKINIAIHEEDDLRKTLKKVVKDLFDYDIRYERDRYVIINSTPLAMLLEEIGFNGTAKTKSVPGWVHSIPVSQKKAFIAGYSDADGHVDEGGIYITSINKRILEDVRELCLSCGIYHSNIFNHGKKRKVTIEGVKCNANNSYRILLNGEKVKEIPSKSKKKSAKIAKIKTKRNYASSNGWNFKSKTNDEIGYARILSIQPLEVKPTFDIEVEKHHNFVANGIIAHNSGLTMLYPASLLLGQGAKTDNISIAYAGKNQNQDTGGKVYHLAPNTSSTINSKSISKDGGITGYRGLVNIAKGAKNSKCSVICDALMFDNESQSNTYPAIDVKEQESDVVHEASVGRISEDQLFYLQSRGLSEEEALQLIVSGFMEPLLKELPLEYAVEMNRLIELEMEGSLG